MTGTTSHTFLGNAFVYAVQGDPAPMQLRALALDDESFSPHLGLPTTTAGPTLVGGPRWLLMTTAQGTVTVFDTSGRSTREIPLAAGAARPSLWGDRVVLGGRIVDLATGASIAVPLVDGHQPSVTLDGNLVHAWTPVGQDSRSFQVPLRDLPAIC